MNDIYFLRSICMQGKDNYSYVKVYRETADCFEETLWGGKMGFKNLGMFWIQNRTTIQCSFLMIWRIMEISEAVIDLGRTPWTICIIPRSILSLIQKLLIDLIHDTRHLCTHFRKCHVVFPVAKQKIKFANARNGGRLCLFSQNETTI